MGEYYVYIDHAVEGLEREEARPTSRPFAALGVTRRPASFCEAKNLGTRALPCAQRETSAGVSAARGGSRVKLLVGAELGKGKEPAILCPTNKRARFQLGTFRATICHSERSEESGDGWALRRQGPHRRGS